MSTSTHNTNQRYLYCIIAFETVALVALVALQILEAATPLSRPLIYVLIAVLLSLVTFSIISIDHSHVSTGAKTTKDESRQDTLPATDTGSPPTTATEPTEASSTTEPPDAEITTEPTTHSTPPSVKVEKIGFPGLFELTNITLPGPHSIFLLLTVILWAILYYSTDVAADAVAEARQKLVAEITGLEAANKSLSGQNTDLINMYEQLATQGANFEKHVIIDVLCRRSGTRSPFIYIPDSWMERSDMLVAALPPSMGEGYRVQDNLPRFALLAISHIRPNYSDGMRRYFTNLPAHDGPEVEVIAETIPIPEILNAEEDPGLKIGIELSNQSTINVTNNSNRNVQTVKISMIIDPEQMRNLCP